MPATVHAPRTTWYPDHQSPYKGHIVHTRSPIPRAWKEASPGVSSGQLANYTPAQQLAVSAYHEAGHAAVLDLCGVEPARIVKAENAEETDAFVQPVGSEHLLNALLVGVAAGHMSEIRFLAEAGLYTPERAWVAERRGSLDQYMADQLCREHLGRPLTYGTGAELSDWERASNTANAMLGVRWGAVARLAEELLLQWEEGDLVMPARQIRQILYQD